MNRGTDWKMIVLWYVYQKALNIINNCILLADVNIPSKDISKRYFDSTAGGLVSRI